MESFYYPLNRSPAPWPSEDALYDYPVKRRQHTHEIHGQLLDEWIKNITQGPPDTESSNQLDKINRREESVRHGARGTSEACPNTEDVVDAGGEITQCSQLDPFLWSLLPSELLERIVTWLPIVSLFKFRTVCRSWNEAPFQPRFRALRAQTKIVETWPLLLTKPHRSISCENNCLAFFFTPDWRKPAALPASFWPLSPSSSGRLSYCMSAGGLICCHYNMGFSSDVEHNLVSLWVGNPCTKKWKCLPPTNGIFPLNFPLTGLAGIVVLNSNSIQDSDRPHATHYKIIVRTHSRHSWGAGIMTEEYDSLTDKWAVTTTKNVPLDHRIEQVVYCNGFLYFMTWNLQDGIYSYNMEKREWSHVGRPRHHHFASPQMVECCGQLILVSYVGKRHNFKQMGMRQYHMRRTGLKLWKLVEEAPTSLEERVAKTDVPIRGDVSGIPGRTGVFWSLLTQMPPELEQDFTSGRRFLCISIQNIIYLTNLAEMLAFHISACRWRRIIIPQLSSLVQGFVSFVPNLEALP
ncbi:hypothetical protein KP509_33G036900 [Ceratopteris richardii]|uniref:F-box domain-containing protein n=1 Tax=Ceratopteris richardii TaxID=49495 RepID=A0A8T2QQH9_CERRI|nr:hypothetical protein KP509_33G036900 [Ceratopteris richardii]